MTDTLPLFYPPLDWIKPYWTEHNKRYSSSEVMELIHTLAAEGIKRGHGPFAAALTDQNGKIVEISVNQVILAHDCGAHAESVVLQNAQRILTNQGHNMPDLNNYHLYTTGEPCVGCAGRIWLYRPKSVTYCLAKKDIEKISNFNEGPIASDFWPRASAERGITLKRDDQNYTIALKVVEDFFSAVKAGTSKPYLER